MKLELCVYAKIKDGVHSKQKQHIQAVRDWQDDMKTKKQTRNSKARQQKRKQHFTKKKESNNKRKSLRHWVLSDHTRERKEGMALYVRKKESTCDQCKKQKYLK